MKKMIVMALMIATGIGANAQDNEVETTVSADVVSSYVWRGQDCGSAAIQPTLGIAYKGLSLTAWGSYGLVDTNDNKEFDLTLAYTTGGFNIGVTDYWFSNGKDPEGRYFKYDAHGTNHVFEANIGYDFGPVALQWYTNFSGNDGVNKNGERAYSSYFEVSAPFKLATCDWTASLGVVPYATDFYENVKGFAVTNVTLKATKDIRVTDTFSIPIFAQVTGNPCSQRAYLALGFTLQP